MCDEYKTLDPKVNSELASAVGWQVPARRGAVLWSTFPARVLRVGTNPNLVMGTILQLLALPGEVPSMEAECSRGLWNRCLRGWSPVKTQSHVRGVQLPSGK